MNWLEIEQQLERFWKGETSLAEEKQIKRAFSREDVPDHMRLKLHTGPTPLVEK